MNIHRFASLVVAIFLFFSVASAHDAKSKSSKKENVNSKACCVTGKTSTQDKEAANAQDCCAREKKMDDSKKEQSPIKKEAK